MFPPPPQMQQQIMGRPNRFALYYAPIPTLYPDETYSRHLLHCLGYVMTTKLFDE